MDETMVYVGSIIIAKQLIYLLRSTSSTFICFYTTLDLLIDAIDRFI